MEHEPNGGPKTLSIKSPNKVHCLLQQVGN